MTSTGPELSALLPGYTFERELGRGAMGIVFLARHEALDRLVAVKELQGALAADPATRQRFIVEATVMASLDHPHVVPVYDFVERADRCALVMERLAGGTVWDRFVDEGLTMPRAVAITLATCSAMQHAHDRGILHRDIKPENLMFDGAGSLKVTDFGIARVVNGASTKATAAGSVLGTPAYMAPEQAEGAEVSPAVDVYAAATMLYEMLSGRLPFDRTDSLGAMLTQRILHDPTPLTTVNPRVPDGIAEATMRALDRSPSRRTPTAERFGVSLARAAVAAWGTSWLDTAGIVLAGSEAIEHAARTADATSRASSPSGARATMLPGDTAAPGERRASNTVIGDVPDAPAADLPHDEVAHDEVAHDSSPPAPNEPPTATEPPTPTEPAAMVAVKPQASDRDVGRARADELDRLIDISELLETPARPIAHFAVAAALLVGGLGWAFVGGGATDVLTDPLGSPTDLTVDGVALAGADEPIELDLTEPIVVDGVFPGQTVAITFDQLGAAAGSTDAVDVTAPGPVSLDPGYVGRVTSGAVDATLELAETATGTPTASTGFDLEATNPWYLSAAGVISSIIVLFAIAAIESALRGLRRSRGRATTFAGLALSGALLGAATAAVCTIVFATPHGMVAIAGPAALCAAGAIALGLATRANRRRRRAARHELRHTAIRALAGSRR